MLVIIILYYCYYFRLVCLVPGTLPLSQVWQLSHLHTLHSYSLDDNNENDDDNNHPHRRRCRHPHPYHNISVDFYSALCQPN